MFAACRPVTDTSVDRVLTIIHEHPVFAVCVRITGFNFVSSLPLILKGRTGDNRVIRNPNMVFMVTGWVASKCYLSMKA